MVGFRMMMKDMTYWITLIPSKVKVRVKYYVVASCVTKDCWLSMEMMMKMRRKSKEVEMEVKKKEQRKSQGKKKEQQRQRQLRLQQL